MEPLSIQMLKQRGLGSFDAFVTAARLKHEGATDLAVPLSAKHVISHTNHQWMDRVLRACAAMEVGGKPFDSDDELAKHTHHDMLLKEMEQETEKIAELVSTVKKERSSGFLVCKNCKSTKVDVDQMQTRSADEPMTLFAMCLDCGNRWTKK